MSNDEIKEMSLDELETRAKQIAAETGEATQEQLDAFNAELDLIEQRKRDLEKEIEDRKKDELAVIEGQGVELNTGKEDRKMTDKEVRSTEKYIDAYVDYIKGKNNGEECRALLTENVSGYVPVPTYIENRIETAWENDEIMSRVKRTYLQGNVKVGVEMSATGAVFHTEGDDAPDEEELVLAIVELVARTCKKWISISTEVMDLRGQAFLDYIYDEIIYQIVRAEAAAVLNVIANAPSTATNAPNVHHGTASSLDITDIVTLAGNLPSARNLAVIANRGTIAAYQAAAMNANYAVDPFIGATVIATSLLPSFDAADTEAPFLIVGDLQAIQANFPAGDQVKLIFDEYSLAEADLVKIVGRQMVGIGLIRNLALAEMTYAAGGGDGGEE